MTSANHQGAELASLATCRRLATQLSHRSAVGSVHAVTRRFARWAGSDPAHLAALETAIRQADARSTVPSVLDLAARYFDLEVHRAQARGVET